MCLITSDIEVEPKCGGTRRDGVHKSTCKPVHICPLGLKAEVLEHYTGIAAIRVQTPEYLRSCDDITFELTCKP